MVLQRCTTRVTLVTLSFAILLQLTSVQALAQTSAVRPPERHSSTNLHEETIQRLRSFTALAGRDGVRDEEILKAMNELSRQVKDEHLATVEHFAMTNEAKPIAWTLARVLVERKRWDGAADLIVTRLAAQKENRAYRMWKWWEYSFGERADYKELSKEITEALFRQFARAGAEKKQVVAELFGKGEAEAQLTVEEFRKAIKAKS